MLTDKKLTYYQPDRYYDDGTNIEYLGTPEGLWSFQAFSSEEECELWLEAHGYNPDDFIIREYHDDDIENVTLIDAYGDIIPKIEDLSDEDIADMITDRILLDAGSIDNLHATRQSDETEDQFKDRVYGEALDKINDTIGCIEEDNEYDFSSFGGNPDVEWYDEAREQALWTVMNWMLEDYPY